MRFVRYLNRFEFGTAARAHDRVTPMPGGNIDVGVSKYEMVHVRFT